MWREEPQLPKFYYFAYGPNLLTFRVHMYSPYANFISIARLDVSADFFKFYFVKYLREGSE